MSVTLHDRFFDFRKTDRTIRVVNNKLREDFVNIDDTGKPFSSTLEKWKVEGDQQITDIKALTPRFNFYDKYQDYKPSNHQNTNTSAGPYYTNTSSDRQNMNRSGNFHDVNTYEIGKTLLYDFKDLETDYRDRSIAKHTLPTINSPIIDKYGSDFLQPDEVAINPIFDKNPGFFPNSRLTVNREEINGRNYYKQNYQNLDVDKQDVTNFAKSFEKPLNGVIQPDEDVLKEYKKKYIEKPKDNFSWIQENVKQRPHANKKTFSPTEKEEQTYVIKTTPTRATPYENATTPSSTTPYDSQYDVNQSKISRSQQAMGNGEKRQPGNSLHPYTTKGVVENNELQASRGSQAIEASTRLELDENEKQTLMGETRTQEHGFVPERLNIDDEVRFYKDTSRRNTQRTDDGWSKSGVRNNYIPGPSTLEYFTRSPATIQDYIYVENKTQEMANRDHNDANNLKMEDDFMTEDVEGSLKIHRKGSKKLKREEKWKTDSDTSINAVTDTEQEEKRLVSPRNVQNSAPPIIFSPNLSQRFSNTNMDNLNFTKISSNLRRSKSNTSHKSLTPNLSKLQRRNSDRTRNSEVTNDGSYIALSGHAFSESQRSRSTLSNDSVYSKENKFSRNSSVYSNTSRQVNHLHDHHQAQTTVMLAKGWSGKIVSTSHGTDQVFDYGLNVSPPQLAESGKNLHGVIFRNHKEINEVQPYDDKEHAMRSLHSLDRRLNDEDTLEMVLFKDSLDWMYATDRDEQPNEKYYRESLCEISMLEELSRNVQKNGWDEGQNMRVHFYHHLHKITTVVNQMIQEIPKKYFPFTIKPLSFQGEFEKKGKYAVDLYLVLEDFNSFNCDVTFTLNKGLQGYLMLNQYRDEHRVFCAQDAENGTRVLSANNLMVVFVYIFHTKICAKFGMGMKHKKKDIPFNAEIKFNKISEGEMRLSMYFPEDDITYDVGLSLSLNVLDFPNVLDSYPHRKWPNASVKNELVTNGIHLLAKHQPNHNHSWRVTFLKTRKVLLNNCDNDNVSTSILLVLQVLNDRVFSNRGCSGLLLPVHFIMTLFWVHVKYHNESDWTRDTLSKRFIDLLIALKRCLQRRQCRDFFFPTTNYLQRYTPEQCHNLALNVQDVLNHPLEYLQSLQPLQQHQSDSNKL